MDIKLIRTIYDYHSGRIGENWASILQLDEAQFIQDVPYSLGSLRN